jgi:hypothetical protein
MRNLFANEYLAREAQYHASEIAKGLGRQVDEDAVVDIYDGTVYQDTAARDPRDLLLGVAFDGFLPFVEDKKYSMWPIVLTPYNYRPSLR